MLDDLLKAAFLGVLQGLTEFLPVSSTGHLILAQKALGIDEDHYGLAFDAALHLGTLLALLWFFGERWRQLIAGGLRTLRARSMQDPAERLAWLIVVGTVPAAALGLVFENQIEDAFRSPALVATMLIAFSAVFLAAEAFGRRGRTMGEMTFVDATAIGFAQAVALVPGVSRSGATISAGLLRDVERQEAAVFAFLLSAPIIGGAGLLKAVDVIERFARRELGWDDAAFFAVGCACATGVGYLSIKYLLRYLAANSLRPFVYYRCALGILVFAVLGVRAIA